MKQVAWFNLLNHARGYIKPTIYVYKTKVHTPFVIRKQNRESVWESRILRSDGVQVDAREESFSFFIRAKW